MKAININATTGEITERDMTPEEIDQMEVMQQVEQTPQEPTLEERVADIEQVTSEVINALNDKGIVP